MSKLAEDKAVDIYVLKRALISTHPGSEELVANLARSVVRKDAGDLHEGGEQSGQDSGTL